MDLNITTSTTNNRLVIKLDGSINTSNAAEAEQKIFEEYEKCPDAEVFIDAENLSYISSVGLRIMLKLKKRNDSLMIVNVNNDVYEIFEMTGFTDIINIKKRLRQFSLEGCKLLGQGGMGKVYRYDADTIIKVYRPEIAIEYIDRERKCSKIAFTNGLPTAIAFDVVKVDEGYGVMYELMDADELASIILNHPEQEDEYIKKYAELAKQIHSTKLEPGTLQPSTEIFYSSMKDMEKHLSADELQLYNTLVELFPARDTLIHGDFHEKNVLVRNGELELIDMGDISQGHPLIELGCIYSTHFMVSDKVIGMPREKAIGIWNKFEEYYFGALQEETKTKLETVLAWIAAMRLLPFLYMMVDVSDPKCNAIIEMTKKKALQNPDEMKIVFDEVSKELFE